MINKGTMDVDDRSSNRCRRQLRYIPIQTLLTLLSPLLRIVFLIKMDSV